VKFPITGSSNLCQLFLVLKEAPGCYDAMRTP
jgi:hypothetical protein